MLIHHALVGLHPKSDAARVKLLEDLAPGNYRGEKLWILDVGANTGAWTSALVKNLPAACLARGVQALFVEPQPLMQPLLEASKPCPRRLLRSLGTLPHQACQIRKEAQHRPRRLLRAATHAALLSGRYAKDLWARVC